VGTPLEISTRPSQLVLQEPAQADGEEDVAQADDLADAGYP
jgi:hypothetical protein